MVERYAVIKFFVGIGNGNAVAERGACLEKITHIIRMCHKRHCFTVGVKLRDQPAIQPGSPAFIHAVVDATAFAVDITESAVGALAICILIIGEHQQIFKRNI